MRVRARACAHTHPYNYTQKDAHTEIFKNYAEIYEEKKILIGLVELLSFLLLKVKDSYIMNTVKCMSWSYSWPLLKDRA